MKLTKPEYNENVVDVDALEKYRIQQAAENERTLIIEQEKTKRENVLQQEQTKRGDNYSSMRTGAIVAVGIILSILAGGVWYNGSTYMDVLKIRAEATKPVQACPPPTKCPELSCQPVPAK